jgi:hypothetical protein
VGIFFFFKFVVKQVLKFLYLNVSHPHLVFLVGKDRPEQLWTAQALLSASSYPLDGLMISCEIAPSVQLICLAKEVDVPIYIPLLWNFNKFVLYLCVKNATWKILSNWIESYQELKSWKEWRREDCNERWANSHRKKSSLTVVNWL